MNTEHDRDIDTTPRYAPTETLINTPEGFRIVPVTGYVFHPPGHRIRVIKPEFGCLELKTEHGSLYWGFDRGWINSELRMVVAGFPARCELRSRWEVCDTT